MKIEMELWHLITLLLAFFACVAAFGKVLLDQVEKRQDGRFAAQDAARAESQKHWDAQFSGIQKVANEWVRLERHFLEFKAELPMTYVLRNDYVRNQTVIEGKLDALALRLENAQLKGAIK
ncbi:MAG: hypothetical protein HYU74_12465 [Dechloromonas sp.]|nr:hypothetical protein [Dechloromonas sp.]